MRSAYLRCIALAVAFSACAILAQRPVPDPGPGTVEIQLLAINDLHGNLEPPSGTNGRINNVEVGGVEYLATHLKRAVARQPRSIFVAAGDLVGASPLLSSQFHDEPSIESLNAMGLSVSSVGNHEFDEGDDELLRMQRGGCHPKDGCQDGDSFDGARFEYLAANVVRKGDGATLFPGTAIRTVGGVKIGFIGETARATSTIVPPSVNREVDFLNEADVANAQAAALKRQGVNAIVLLIHEGFRRAPADSSDPNTCASSGAGLAPVLERLSNDIPVVISGHSHESYICRIGNHLVTSASSFGRMLTTVRLEVDAKSGRILKASATNQLVTHDVDKDATQSKIVARYSRLVEEAANKVVGSVASDLVRQSSGTAGEIPLGDVVADAQLAAASAPETGQALVAFTNRGGIRADILAGPQASGERPRPVTYRELYAVQPFRNVLTTFTMTGDMIRRVLEQQFDNPGPGRAQILQVSQGFTYSYRWTAPAGQHIDANSMRLNGRPIQPEDRIRVAASDFLLNGGDRFSVFAESTDRRPLMDDIDALVDYFAKHSPVRAPAQVRITRLD